MVEVVVEKFAEIDLGVYFYLCSPVLKCALLLHSSASSFGTLLSRRSRRGIYFAMMVY